MNNLKLVGAEIEKEENDFNIIYTGPKDALITAGIAKECMFAQKPKRNAWGWMDNKTFNQLTWEEAHSDKYDMLGDTRPIGWTCERRKGGIYRLRIDKTLAQRAKEKETARAINFLTYCQLITHLDRLLECAVLARTSGNTQDNPEGYHLSNHVEIAAIISKLRTEIANGQIRTRKRQILQLVTSN